MPAQGAAPVTPGNRARWDWPIALPLLGLLAAYRRWLSPLLPAACRFEPSCSQYAVDALHEHAAPRALALIVWRLLRCQPLSRGGCDPVPPRSASAFSSPCACLSRPAPDAQETHP